MSTAGAQEHDLDRESAPAYSATGCLTDDPATEGGEGNPPQYSGPRHASTSRSGRIEPGWVTSSTQRTVEHSFSLSRGSKTSLQQPWLTLKLYSYAASSDVQPVFFQGKSINGLVELQVDKPEDIKDVSVTVRG